MRCLRSRLGVFLCVLVGMGAIAPPLVHAQGDGVAPPQALVVKDQPNDVGNGLIIEWELSPDDVADAETRQVTGYRIYRSMSFKAKKDAGGIWRCKPDLFNDVKPEMASAKQYPERAKVYEAADAAANGADTVEFQGPFLKIKDVPYGTTKFEDPYCIKSVSYLYRIVSLGPDGQESAAAETSKPIKPKRQWYDMRLFFFMIIMVTICGSVVYFIEAARAGKKLKVRKIAGLQAVEEAVGRATEMGRSCLYISGLGDMNEIQTIASITILSRLAKVAAEHDAKIEMPNCRSLVMTTARETVKAAFLAAGRPDAYNEDLIYYVTDEQFGFVAAVSGLMVRDKPAACFYLGQFYAESLILAETGNSIGAIQIAGTAMPAQLPFFVASCDYTLIGEEFYAASAYLSGEPHQLGSLKGQDVGKSIVGIGVVIGCTLATLGVIMTYMTGNESNIFNAAVDFIKYTLLSTGG